MLTLVSKKNQEVKVTILMTIRNKYAGSHCSRFLTQKTEDGKGSLMSNSYLYLDAKDEVEVNEIKQDANSAGFPYSWIAVIKTKPGIVITFPFELHYFNVMQNDRDITDGLIA